MKLNLAVYTATEGYSWQYGTRISNDDLIEYKRIIGRFPDPLVDSIPFGGAFIYHDKVVFYRFHIAKHADSKGRDALYLILGECFKATASKIDFNSLFAKNEMTVPCHPFPFEMDYIGAGASPCSIDFKNSFTKILSRREDLSSLGYILANCPNDELYIKISGNQVSPNISVTYRATPMVNPQTSVSSPKFFASQQSSAKNLRNGTPFSSSFNPEINQPKNNIYFLLIFTTVVALILGFIIGYWSHGFKSELFKDGIDIGGGFKLTRPNKPEPQPKSLFQPKDKPQLKTQPRTQVPHQYHEMPTLPQDSSSTSLETKCSQCKGSGIEEIEYKCNNRRPDCKQCHGTGWYLSSRPCEHCNGKGVENQSDAVSSTEHKKTNTVPEPGVFPARNILQKKTKKDDDERSF